MENVDLRERLAARGAERLATELVRLADHDSGLRRDLELIALEGDSGALATALRRRVAGLARAKKFIPYREVFDFARTLDSLLERVRTSLLDSDPKAASSVLEAFIKTDAATFERIDDSSGSVGDSFRWACRLYLQAAARAKARSDWVKHLYELAAADDYGVREPLLKHADELLSEHELRRLAKRFETDLQEIDPSNDDNYRQYHIRGCLSLVARALRDPRLEERTMAQRDGGLNKLQRLELARRCIEYGQIEEAERHLHSVTDDPERWSLLAQCHERAGREPERIDCLWRYFELTFSWSTLEELLALLPTGEQEGARRRARKVALAASDTAVAATLLLELDFVIDAQRLVVERHGSLDGCFYTRLTKLAKLARDHGASGIEIHCYRALLNDILDEGRTRAYGHAARYLKRLYELDDALTSYKPAVTHTEYVATLRNLHGRKYSFWQRVDGKS